MGLRFCWSRLGILRVGWISRVGPYRTIAAYVARNGGAKSDSFCKLPRGDWSYLPMKKSEADMQTVSWLGDINRIALCPSAGQGLRGEF